MEEQTQSPWSELFADVFEDAPPQDSGCEFHAEEVSGVKTERRFGRQRKGENVRPTALQMKYQRQVRLGKEVFGDISRDLSRLVAWTWIPGRDRKECPEIVDLRDPRLLVMDRFPNSPGGEPYRIGLSMYRPFVQHNGHSIYAGPRNLEMFKDFSLRPHHKAGGIILDSNNEEIFRQALALDREMKLVLRGKVESCDVFEPPEILLGFPHHYTPTPEWRRPMHEALLEAMSPHGTTLCAMLSPGGRIMSISETGDGFRSINVQRTDSFIKMRIPSWAILSHHTVPGAGIPEGVPLADLPRTNFKNIRELSNRYSPRALEWVERQILDQFTEWMILDEHVYDFRDQSHYVQEVGWKVIPSRFVQTQVGRAVRQYADMRQLIGRKTYTLTPTGEDVHGEDTRQCRINVMRFPTRPTVKDLQFCDGTNEYYSTWSADLMTPPHDAAWKVRCFARGLPD